MKNRNILTFCMVCLMALCCCVPALAGQGPQPEGRPQGGELSLRTWSAEELEPLQQGLSQRAAEWQGHGLPTAEQIQLPQALALTEQALQQHKGLTSAEIATYAVLPYFITENSWVNVDGAPVDLPAPYWQMNYGNGDYTVYLNAITGEVLAIPDFSDGNG